MPFHETDSDGTTTNTLINDYSIHGRSFVGITVDIQISYLTSCTCVASCMYCKKKLMPMETEKKRLHVISVNTEPELSHVKHPNTSLSGQSQSQHLVVLILPSPTWKRHGNVFLV